MMKFLIIFGTVKPVYKRPPSGPKFVAVVDRWSLFRAEIPLCYKQGKRDYTIVVAVDKWSLFGGDR